MLGRNPAGMDANAYEEHFRHAAAAGERFMRIHFTWLPDNEKVGEIDAGMLTGWDAILEPPRSMTLPCCPCWACGPTGTTAANKEAWHRWDHNPYNACGAARRNNPASCSATRPCRKLWLKRLETFVRHWAHRRAIVAGRSSPNWIWSRARRKSGRWSSRNLRPP